MSHVKKVSSEKGISYKEAMSVAKSTYSKPAKAKVTKEPKVKEAGEAKAPAKKKKEKKEEKQEMPDMVSKAEKREKLVVKHDKGKRVESAESKGKKKATPLMQ